MSSPPKRAECGQQKKSRRKRSLPAIPPTPTALAVAFTPQAILLRGARLFKEHGQPVADIAEFRQLAHIAKHNLPFYRQHAPVRLRAIGEQP